MVGLSGCRATSRSVARALAWQALPGTRAALLAISGVTLAQLAVTCLPALQAVFGTRALAFGDGLAIVAVGVVLFAILEAEKWLLHRLGRAKGGQAPVTARLFWTPWGPLAKTRPPGAMWRSGARVRPCRVCVAHNPGGQMK